MSDQPHPYRLLVIGCPECRGWGPEGLVEEIVAFPSIDAAKQHVADLGVRATWSAHPLGGEFFGHGSGDYWIAPTDALLNPANDGPPDDDGTGGQDRESYTDTQDRDSYAVHGSPETDQREAQDPGFRKSCIRALTDALSEGHGTVEPQVVEAALDALLPVIGGFVKPHRWDKDYPDSAAEGPCQSEATADTFYWGVLHAVRVVRELLPPKPPSPSHVGPRPL